MHCDLMTVRMLAEPALAALQAIAALNKAMATDPNNAEVLLSLGVSYTNELDQGRALNFLTAWLSRQPAFTRVCSELYEFHATSGTLSVHGPSIPSAWSFHPLCKRWCNGIMSCRPLYTASTGHDAELVSCACLVMLRRDASQTAHSVHGRGAFIQQEARF